MSDFITVTLEDVCTKVTDGTHDSPKLQKSGVPFIKAKHITNGTIDFNNCDFITQTEHEKVIARSKPEYNDILFTNIGASIGRSAIIKSKIEFSIKNVALFKPDNETIDPDYLFFKVNSTEFQEGIKNYKSGSAQPFVSLGSLREFKFDILNGLTKQKYVAEVLINYDNLIENNNRRIAILEDMAQSLYREWFVNFRYPNHQDNLDADGNPKLIDSPLGQIPDGWEVKSAAEVITINPKTKLVKEGEKPFVGMSGLSQGSMVIGDIIKKTGNSGAKFINGDTLFARITPCLQNGKTGYVQFLTSEQPVGFGSTEFIVLRESEDLSSEYIYLLSRSNNFREHAIQSMTGATGRQRVHNDCFASCYLPVPPKELMNEFTQLVKPMFKNIFNLSKRNENLKQQRDMLLPKLISGTIEL